MIANKPCLQRFFYVVRNMLIVTLLTQFSVAAQLDSLQQDSLDKVVMAEERAALIPSEYASLIIDVNDEYYPQLREARSLIFDRGITNLLDQHEDLQRLTDYVLLRNNVLESIQSLEEKWRSQINDVNSYADDLEASTTAIIDLKKTLAEKRSNWLDTEAKLEYGEHPPEIVTYSGVAVDTIDYFLDQGATIIDTFTVMYADVVELLLDGREVADRLKSMRQSRVATLMTEKKPFIWSSRFGYDTDAVREHMEYLRGAGMTDARYYVREHSSALVNSALFFAIFIFVFYWTRNRSRNLEDEEEPELVRNIHILEQPFTMAIFSTLVVLSLMLPNLPPLFSYISSLILLYCVIMILAKVMRGHAKWMSYTLAVLLFLLQFDEFISGGEGESRWLTLLVSMVITYMMVWVRRNRKYLRSGTQHGNWPALFIRISPILAIVGLAAVVVNVIGYSRIADLLNSGSILTLVLGLLLLSMFSSLMSVVYHFFHTTFANNSVIIKEDGDKLFSTLTRLLSSVLVLVYLFYCLNFFLVWEPISDFLVSLWELGYDFGTVSLTVGSVVNVFLTILAFYVVALIIAIVLRKEIFHRIDLPRGIGNAVASVTQYTLVVVGVFMALASAGFESRHLGILAGALGVGIGFGLQTIVNNFLSGLILVFERPITVDDVVEVDGVLGVVTSIGIRASKIRQYNGDEVIVPNSDLISKRVTNRTLSDTKRRYTMAFTTGRNVAPDLVVAAVEQAVQGLEGILHDPATRAYFKGTVHQTNHYYINYWGAGNFLDLMNNAQIAVYKALEKVGASVPVDITIELNQLPDDLSTI